MSDSHAQATPTEPQAVLPGLPGPAAPTTTRRKYDPGERGYHPGRWPTEGPYTVRRRQLTERGSSNVATKPKYANVCQVDDAPEASWFAFCARTYGPGMYQIVGADNAAAPARLEVRREDAKRAGYYTPQSATRARPPVDDEDDDDDDDQDDDDEREPDLERSPIAELTRRTREIAELREALGVRDNPPPVAPVTPLVERLAQALLTNPQALAALGSVLQQLTAAAPPQPPPPPPQPADPMAQALAELRARGITAADVVRAFTAGPQPQPQPPAPQSVDDADADYAEAYGADDGSGGY